MIKALSCAALLASAVPAYAAIKCPKGQHFEHHGSFGRCVTDKFVQNSGSMHSAEQEAEKKGWHDFDAAMDKYKNAQGAYGLAKTRRDGAQHRVDHTACMQFACNNSEARGAVITHEGQMDAAKDRMGDAVAACKKAVKEIEDAREKEKAAHVSHVSQRVASCPSAGGGHSSFKCAHGMHFYLGKCIKTPAAKPAH